jgi:hypothetical protein
VTQSPNKLHWPNVHRAAAAKQRLLTAAAACNGHKTPEVVEAVNRFNALFGKLTERERYAVNQLA